MMQKMKTERKEEEEEEDFGKDKQKEEKDKKSGRGKDLFFSVSTIGSRKLSTNSSECWVGGVTKG